MVFVALDPERSQAETMSARQIRRAPSSPVPGEGDGVRHAGIRALVIATRESIG